MWTKTEVAKLTVEQQEVLARFELSKLRQRQQLIEVVRGRDWRSRCIPIIIWIPCLVILVLEFCNFFVPKKILYVNYALNGFILFCSLICVLNARINQRLDALVKLLDLDHKDQTDSNNSKAEKIG
jgi:hypothetical protein